MHAFFEYGFSVDISALEVTLSAIVAQFLRTCSTDAGVLPHLFFLFLLLYIFDFCKKRTTPTRHAQIPVSSLDTMVRLVLWLRRHTGSSKD
jgi:hypothetical protein